MDWNAIERSVHVHALSVLTDNRRQAQRSPEIHIPLSKLETSDSRNYDKELRNNGEPVEKSMDTRQLQVVMNMIASQGEKIELLQRDFDRAVRETKEERDAWMSRVRVAEDISARASASLADALSEKRILEDSISSLASRLARLEAAVVENETAFATKRNFEILRSEILFEAAQARGLAISACTESTDSKRMVLEIVNAFVEHAHFHDLYQLLNSKESDNASAPHIPGGVLQRCLGQGLEAAVVDAVRRVVAASENIQESNKQRGLPQLEAIESQLRRMHVDVKRIEEMLNAIGKKCQLLESDAVDVRAAIEEIRVIVNDDSMESQIRACVEKILKNCGVKDSKSSPAIPNLTKEVSILKNTMESLRDQMASMLDAVSHGSFSRASELLEGSTAETRRGLNWSSLNYTFGPLNTLLSNDLSTITPSYRMPVTNYYSSRLQGSDLKVRPSYVPNADRFTSVHHLTVFSENQNENNKGWNSPMDPNQIANSFSVTASAADKHGIQGMAGSARSDHTSVSTRADQRNMDPKVELHLISTPFVDSSALGDGNSVFRSGDAHPISERKDGDAATVPSTSPESEEESPSDRGRSPVDEDARSIDVESSDGEITIGPSDRSLRPMGPSIPPRSGNQESLVPGRQPRTPRPVAPRGPGGAGAAPTLPVNVPSAVSVKTSSSSDDTTQCQYCLRRVKKTDAKHHGTVCELRTETCRLGCRARVLAIKMDKHCEICPCNPHRVGLADPSVMAPAATTAPASIPTSTATYPHAPPRPPPLPPSAAVVAASLSGSGGRSFSRVAPDGSSRTTPSLI